MWLCHCRSDGSAAARPLHAMCRFDHTAHLKAQMSLQSSSVPTATDGRCLHAALLACFLAICLSSALNLKYAEGEVIVFQLFACKQRSILKIQINLRSYHGEALNLFDLDDINSLVGPRIYFCSWLKCCPPLPRSEMWRPTSVWTTWGGKRTRKLAFSTVTAWVETRSTMHQDFRHFRSTNARRWIIGLSFFFFISFAVLQVFSYTADKEIRTDDLCLDVSRLNGPVLMLKCHHMKGNQMFEYDAEVGARSQISLQVAVSLMLAGDWWRSMFLLCILSWWLYILMHSALERSWTPSCRHMMALYDSLLNGSWVSSTRCVFPLVFS